MKHISFKLYEVFVISEHNRLHRQHTPAGQQVAHESSTLFRSFFFRLKFQSIKIVSKK